MIVEAHVTWFVDTATTTIEPYRLWEPTVLFTITVAIFAFAGLIWLNRYDRLYWKASTGAMICWLIIAAVLSLVTYHQELLTVYVGLVLFSLLYWHYPKLALRSLMIGVGISLIQAAFVEKLWQPELAATFLAGHHWNWWLNDRQFILFAGISEIVFGLAILSGVMVRLMTAILLISTAVFALDLGWSELLGHIPVLMALIIISSTYGKAAQA